MTIDREKLKALAEQASRPGWRWMTEFTLATGPEVILDLITEIEQLEKCLDMESAELAWSDSDGRAIQAERDQLKAENEALRALLDTPHTAEWFEGVKLEAGHQIKRWVSEHDAGKSPADWFRAIVGDSTAMRPGIEAQAEDDVPDFTPGNGNKARRRAEALGIDYDAATARGEKS